MQANPDKRMALKMVKQRDIGFGKCVPKEMVKVADGLVIMDTEKKINFFHNRPGKNCSVTVGNQADLSRRIMPGGLFPCVPVLPYTQCTAWLPAALQVAGR